MHNLKKCKCGSADVVYVVQTGRKKKSEAFCEFCLPVNPEKKEEVETKKK